MGTAPGRGAAPVPPRFSARAGLCQHQGGTFPCHAGYCPSMPDPPESWGKIIAPMPWQRKPKPPKRRLVIQGKVERPELPMTAPEWRKEQGWT